MRSKLSLKLRRRLLMKSTASGFLGSVDDVVHTVPHINAHFDKQVSCDYNGKTCRARNQALINDNNT